MGFIKEFREFAIKGNAVDLAVGVIIGAAFGAIVSAVVEQILMPIVGIITGGINFDALVLKVGDAQLKYGMAITAIVKFLAIAFFLFLIIKAVNKFQRNQAPSPPSAPSATEQLLTEIRDLLKQQSQ